jgi:hypothetical protein
MKKFVLRDIGCDMSDHGASRRLHQWTKYGVTGNDPHFRESGRNAGGKFRFLADFAPILFPNIIIDFDRQATGAIKAVAPIPP